MQERRNCIKRVNKFQDRIGALFAQQLVVQMRTGQLAVSAKRQQLVAFYLFSLWVLNFLYRFRFQIREEEINVEGSQY